MDLSHFLAALFANLTALLLLGDPVWGEMFGGVCMVINRRLRKSRQLDVVEPFQRRMGFICSRIGKVQFYGSNYAICTA